MGQPIKVEATQVSEVVIFDTDRSITGQDGSGFASLEEAAAVEIFPAQLAARLFQSDDTIDHVFVASNQVVVRRPSGWDTADVARASGVITDFFLFYPEAASG